MGCISSKKESDNSYPRIFEVINVDEHGNRIRPGELEITDFDLILYQRGKPPIKWPLKTLRRYGFDSEHFSFESGRRCPTGPGIYAFRCHQAEQLFNLLQSRIQGRSIGEGGDPTENIPHREIGYLEPSAVRRILPGTRFSSHSGILRRYPTANSSGNLGGLSSQSSTSRSSSLDSTSFAAAMPVPRSVSQKLYANEEVIASLVQEMEERNNNKGADEPPPPLFNRSYTNAVILDTLNSKGSRTEFPISKKDEHIYMNIIPGTGNVIPVIPTVRHANVPSEPVGLVQSYSTFISELALMHKRSPPQPPPKKLNYIVLDLEPSSDGAKPPNSSPPPVAAAQPSPGYAAIDFRKTVALSHSVNPNFDHDSEGSRKTRHNSNIDDLPTQTRHSSSASD